MAGRLVKEASQTITGVDAKGIVTVASTVGFYAGAVAYLRADGQTGLAVKIAEVTDSTHMKVRAAQDPRGGGVGTTSADIHSNSNYGYSDPSAYNGGAISMPAQLVYNPNDLGLS